MDFAKHFPSLAREAENKTVSPSRVVTHVFRRRWGRAGGVKGQDSRPAIIHYIDIHLEMYCSTIVL